MGALADDEILRVTGLSTHFPTDDGVARPLISAWSPRRSTVGHTTFKKTSSEICSGSSGGPSD